MRLGARVAVSVARSGRRGALGAPLLAVAAVLAGCGSARVQQLPPPVGRARDVAPLTGGRSVVLLGRARVLELRDGRGRLLGRAPAGVGPTDLACADHGVAPAWCYVTDTRGNALLVFAVGTRIEPRRRLYLPGGPDGVTLDHGRRRLLVTLKTHEVVELPAHGRPHVLRRRPPRLRTGPR
jgi:hypothetical protein